MSAPKELIDLTAWYPLNFLLETFYLNYYYHNRSTTQKNTKNSTRSKNYPKGKTLRELQNLTLIDWDRGRGETLPRFWVGMSPGRTKK